MSQFYSANAIVHHVSCVETPEENGIAERKHQHIHNIARALKFQCGLPMNYLGYCVLHVDVSNFKIKRG